MELLRSRHRQRLEALGRARERAMAQLWWPFTQHGALLRDSVQVRVSPAVAAAVHLLSPRRLRRAPTAMCNTLFDSCLSLRVGSCARLTQAPS